NLKDINVKIESIHQRQQLGLQVIKAQEEERKRVAREIHDGPAQSMANVVLRMEFCEKLLDVDPEKARQELKELKEVVRGNLQDVRKIIFDLRPMALDDLGLVPALKRFLEDYRDKWGLEVEPVFRGTEKRLAPALEIALFRLVQEALNNVRKHAHARKVVVTLGLEPKMITAGVKDDGQGFDLKQALAVRSGDSFGLISMKERVELLGGRMEIKTEPGRGTKVLFRIPVTGQEG
ncbi:MAG: sensor histidine kinase, partial [Bacillota bacterium]